MLKEDREIEQGAYGCAAIVLFSILALVVSIAVGVFFGAGFGGLSPLPCSSCSRSPALCARS